MSSTRITPNFRESIAAVSTITGKTEYLSSTNNALNVNASVSITGGATSANQTSGAQKTQIVDGAGNVIGATSNALDINVKSGSLSISAVTPGTGATNLGKAEDAPHTTGDVGVMALALRNDTGAVSAGADGDYIALTTDATGALRIDLNGTLSTNNSSTAVLGAAGVFTGTSEDVLNYNEIRIAVTASHASATDGLSIQQSPDNTNWDITDTYTIPAATGKTFSVPRQARYFRIVYTNGGTLQTSFRLQAILNRDGARVSSQRPNDAYTNETDLEQVQSFLMGYNGATWDRVRTTATGVLSVNGVLTAGAAIIGKVGIDQTTPGTTNLVALAANQSVNNAQINGITPLMGNGVTGTGSQRVTIASDNTAFSVNATATGNVAHAATDSGNPVKIGGKATSTPSAVTTGQRVDALFDLLGRLSVFQKSQTATLSNVASSATNVTLLSANVTRIGAQLYNDSTQVCYVKFGVAATNASFTVPLATNTYYEVPGGYQGQIDGIWVSANGNMRVTELT